MLNLIIFSFLSVLISLPFGCLFLKDNNKTIINYSVLLLYGIIVISFLSIILNFFTPLNKITSTFVIFGALFIIFNKKSFFFNFVFLKFSLTAALIVFLLVSKSTVYRPDAFLYHLPFIDILNQFKIIFGLNNLHFRFGHTSILQYSAAIFNNFIFFEKGIFLPAALIASSIILNFSTQLYNYIKNNNFNSHFFYLLFIIIYVAYKMNRYGEYGNDYPAHFIFYYLISEIILSLKNKNKNNIFSNLFLVSTFILMNKLSMIFSILLPFLILSKNQKEQIFNIKNYFTLTFLSFWIIKNLLISGCVFYPVAKTCIESLPWTNVYEAKKISIETEAWSKNWNNEKDPKYRDQETYNENFNWIGTWSNNHLKTIIKILYPYIIFLILITLYIIFKSRKIQKATDYRHEMKLLFVLLILISIWFIKTPLFRFGFSYLISLISLFFAIVCSKYENFNNRKIFISLLILCTAVFVGKNSLRLLNYPNQSNSNIWPKIKLYDNEKQLKKINTGELKYYESTAECGFGFAPCTHYKNLQLRSINYGSFKIIIKK